MAKTSPRLTRLLLIGSAISMITGVPAATFGASGGAVGGAAVGAGAGGGAGWVDANVATAQTPADSAAASPWNRIESPPNHSLYEQSGDDNGLRVAFRAR